MVGSADGNPTRISSIGKCDISTENERGESVDFILWRKAHLSTREFIWRIYSVASVFYFNITSTKWDVVADGACARVKVSVGRCASTIVRLSIDTCRVYKDC